MKLNQTGRKNLYKINLKHAVFVFILFGSLGAVAWADPAADDVARGNAKQDQGDYDGAIADWQETIALDSSWGGLLQARINQIRARPKKLAVVNTPPVDGYAKEGVAKERVGDYVGALADYNRALELNPNDAKTYNNRGKLKNGTVDYDEALADFNRAIELDSQFADAYYSRGWAKKNQGDYAGALPDFEKSVELDPSRQAPVQPWIDLAKAKLNKGHNRPAGG